MRVRKSGNIFVYLQKNKNMEQEKINTRGGKREGAGRPKKDDAKQPITVRFDADVHKILKSKEFLNQFNLAQFVNDSVRERLMSNGFINAK